MQASSEAARKSTALGKKKLFAVGFVVLVVLLAVAGHFLPNSLHYDATTALDVLTLLTIAAYTYLTYGLLDHTQKSIQTERERRRDTVATAVLVELVIAEDRLRYLYQREVSEYSTSLGHPLVRHAIDNIDLFDPGTAYALVRFYESLRGLEQQAVSLWHLKQNGLPVSFTDAQCNQVVFALTLLDQLQKQLRPFGEPLRQTWLTYPENRKDRLPLPKRAFADISEVSLET